MTKEISERKASKKTVKKYIVRLTAWVDPPFPQSGQVNVNYFGQVAIFGVILPFYKRTKIGKNSSIRLGGVSLFLSFSLIFIFSCPEQLNR